MRNQRSVLLLEGSVASCREEGGGFHCWFWRDILEGFFFSLGSKLEEDRDWFWGEIFEGKLTWRASSVEEGFSLLVLERYFREVFLELGQQARRG